MEIKTMENLLTTKSRRSGSASALRREQSKCTQQICPKKGKKINPCTSRRILRGPMYIIMLHNNVKNTACTLFLH